MNHSSMKPAVESVHSHTGTLRAAFPAALPSPCRPNLHWFFLKTLVLMNLRKRLA